jgi:hypothetical protein
MKIALNSNFGPFEGASFWRKQQEEVENFTNGHCHHDPLFQQEWPAIAAASGLGRAESIDDDVQAQFFSTMQNSPAFTTKGPRLQPSRWHSFLDVYEHWRPYLPLRRLVLTYHGIMEGWVLRLPGACVFQNTGPANRQEDAPKAPTSIVANAAVTAKLWKVCANTLHVSLMILLDLDVLRKCEIMWQMSRPLREWHADQAMLLRSPAESILYNIAQASGQAAHSISAILGGMTWMPLAKMGFATALKPVHDTLALESPEVAEEDEWMMLVSKLGLLLIKHRFCGAQMG